MILTGAVIITNRRYGSELNAANVVYEQIGDRLSWQVYRFQASRVNPQGVHVRSLRTDSRAYQRRLLRPVRSLLHGQPRWPRLAQECRAIDA